MSRGQLVVSDVTLVTAADRVTLSGDVGAGRVFWAMPVRPSIALRGEPFVAALLVSAMRSGRDLVLPANAPVDAEFLAAIAEIQVIFARWFAGLTRITVMAPSIAPRVGASGRMVGYSGGVDSSYSVMRAADGADGTVLFDGIEYGEPNPALMSAVGATLAHTMAQRQVPLTTVQTNVKAVGRATGGYWSEFIGGALASIPHALGLADYTVAGSNSWENLRPYGTHPYTDPLWGSSSLRIHHHGAEALRIEKIAALAQAPDLLAVLRVCFQGEDYNCGVCHKCLQTSAALRALRLVSPAMPPLDDPKLLRRLVVEHEGDLVDWVEILTPGLEARDPALAHELGRLIRRYRVRTVMKQLDQVLLAGGGRNTLRRLGVLGRGKPKVPPPGDEPPPPAG
ncbi:MAG: hypothetical protein ABIZ70_16100 [Gemmatimonadales bacterium]